MSFDRPIYSIQQINPQDQQTLNEITHPKNWDWGQFRSVLIALATLGPGNYIPSRNRPDSVGIDGLQETIEELKSIGHQRGGVETAKTVFVDVKNNKLLISGKTFIGNKYQCPVDTTPPHPELAVSERFVASIHTHFPTNQTIANGFSPGDYIPFIHDQRQLALFMTWFGGTMIALKTTSTPNMMNETQITRQMGVINNDFFANSSSTQGMLRLIDFNKAVCMEFGLTLYSAPSANKNLATRVEVTR